ncbi:hypothetical protein [Streptomyces sp. SP18BB07]|uniref:hypothetical protein n=1 Tax=Streptomyces sp. SP18BB07 TaxID=3002522 RepID=UPI002E77659F|nr:hypothetical protein [Streptomyces sp. SP18BB07]MEE1757681.1 hypothetical protein [Streptomyces sp. SP18BB07]
MKQFVVTLELLAGPPGPEVTEAQQAFLAKLFEQGTLVNGESPVVRSSGAAVDVRAPAG